MIEKILRLAEKKNMSIREIEREAGLANGTIGKWASKRPLAENLQKVAAVLGVRIEDLLNESR